MNRLASFMPVIVMLVVLIVTNVFYVVDETQRAVLLQFGRLKEVDIKPGLHIKIPLIQKVYKFDGRVLTLDTETERYLTVEKKAFDVDAFVKWRVADVATYYTATAGNEAFASDRLLARARDGLRNQFGVRTKHEVVSGQRDLLMKELTEQVNKTASKELGIEVIDIRIKRIDLPQDVSDSVFDRMNTERDRVAREYRAQGNKEAESLRAEADREREVILANADGEAERIRGEGDAKAAEIYAKAYSKNPEFYTFYRSLLAYKEAFANKNDVLVLDPQSDFFKYLQSPKKQ
jgi:membrane protease subunit HflC